VFVHIKHVIEWRGKCDHSLVVLFYALYTHTQTHTSYDTGGVFSVINFQPHFVKINSSKYATEGHK
jgi:hypothetical protein